MSHQKLPKDVLKFNNEITEMFCKLDSLIESIAELKKDIKDMNARISQHHEQLLLITMVISWTLKYGVAFIAIAGSAYEAYRHIIPH